MLCAEEDTDRPRWRAWISGVYSYDCECASRFNWIAKLKPSDPGSLISDYSFLRIASCQTLWFGINVAILICCCGNIQGRYLYRAILWCSMETPVIKALINTTNNNNSFIAAVIVICNFKNKQLRRFIKTLFP